jgi:hypothetical protein
VLSPHMPRDDGLTHHADTSRSNLGAALGLLSRRPNPKWSPHSGAAVAYLTEYLVLGDVQHTLPLQHVRSQHPVILHVLFTASPA